MIQEQEGFGLREIRSRYCVRLKIVGKVTRRGVDEGGHVMLQGSVLGWVLVHPQVGL